MAFRIHLGCMDDLHSYANLFKLFTFSAYVKGKYFLLEAHDVLALFSYCPQEDFLLVLTDYKSAEIKAIQEYLRNMDLLVKEE